MASAKAIVSGLIRYKDIYLSDKELHVYVMQLRLIIIKLIFFKIHMGLSHYTTVHFVHNQQPIT